MLGRALFALVWLVIAAGLALPLYPSDLGAPGSSAVDHVLLAADSVTAACESEPIPDNGSVDCQPGCPCGHVLLATFVAIDDDLSVVLVIRSQPSDLPFERHALPPKLPAI
jgi:hypothetical protein